MTENLKETLTAEELKVKESATLDFDAAINKFAAMAKTKEDLCKKIANAFVSIAYSYKNAPTKRSFALSDMRGILKTNPHTKGAIERHITKALKEQCGIEHTGAKGWVISAEKDSQFKAQKWVKENSILTYGDKTPKEKQSDSKKRKEEKQEKLDESDNPYKEVLEFLEKGLKAQKKRFEEIDRVTTENAPEIEQRRARRERTKLEIFESIVTNVRQMESAAK